ncbi:hypothetical protein LXA43DRAFT_1015489 [Ganoderma leucocontextum]|nr:hypothetical protein LXA43DRAFT_1015489 [Ganoderma leucocontextum]
MDVKNRGPESILGLWSSKKGCDWCNAPRAEALKQCTGCAAIRYCSKECQSAAWPNHKHICSSRSALKVPSIYSMLGHTTSIELLHAGLDWWGVHKLIFYMFATVLVELGGGVDDGLKAPRAVVFELGPPFASGFDRSPSTRFTLKSMGFVHRDALDGCTGPQWFDSSIAYRDSLGQFFRSTIPNPDAAGIIPVTFTFRDSTITAQTGLPLFRPRGGAVDQRTKTVLKKLLEIGTVGINTGTVLRIPTNASQSVPDIGKLVREGKSWTWTPYASPARIPMMQFRAPAPDDAFAAYHRLWPYSSLLTTPLVTDIPKPT